MPPKTSTLGTLHPGDSATVLALDVSEELHRRLTALGLRVGKTVRVLRRGRFSGAVHVRIGTTDLMMRAGEARAIRVRPLAS